jgi:prostaglandin-H2 D-isomerase / glutathione transferase
MAKPKITYFDFAGSRGEEVRLALAIAGVAFDDNRIGRDAFAAIKEDLPFGSLPVFEVSGHGPVAQTNAILRLIGRKHGLHPDDAWEGARHDAVMEACEDLRQRLSAGRFGRAEVGSAGNRRRFYTALGAWHRRFDR